MGPFQHFILTRFNRNCFSRYRMDKNGNPINSPDWFEHRLQMFETYCLPSLLAQTNQNFQWLLQFDDGTPEEIISRYSRYPNIIPVFDEFPDAVRKRLRKDRGSFVITSRLDNDDAYHVSFVDRIQERFSREKKLIDIHGVQYDSETGKFYSVTRTKPGSPFISLVEEASGEVKTVFYKMHYRMSEHFPSVYIRDILYLQVIHEHNLSNKISGHLVEGSRYKVGFPFLTNRCKSASE